MHPVAGPVRCQQSARNMASTLARLKSALVATLSGGLQQATRTMVLEQVDNVVPSNCAAINPNAG
jgi:hypothetical protein